MVVPTFFPDGYEEWQRNIVIQENATVFSPDGYEEWQRNIVIQENATVFSPDRYEEWQVGILSSMEYIPDSYEEWASRNEIIPQISTFPSFGGMFWYI